MAKPRSSKKPAEQRDLPSAPPRPYAGPSHPLRMGDRITGETGE
jgi:hypothetical protein